MISILFAVSSLIAKYATTDPVYATNASIYLIVASSLFIIVSVWVTVASIHAQESDYINLNKKRNEINACIDIYKAKNKEVQEMTEKMLSHELNIIKSISPENSMDPQNFTDNILSKNLLTQLPDCHAVSSVKQMIGEIDSKRDYIGNALSNYNDRICNIKTRQGNPLIYSPFVKKYEVHFVEVENLDDPEQAKIKITEA
jgi:hypothetical protein